MKTPRHNQGAIALSASIILGGAMAAIALALTLNGLSSRLAGAHRLNGQITRIRLEGCLEETLIRLKRDPAYSGGFLTIDGINCSVVVEGSGNTRTLTVSWTESTFTKSVQAVAQLTPETFGIMQWNE